MIQLSNIFKWYNVGGNRSFVLKDINLTISEGEFVSIMGPSGPGKSTLLPVWGPLDEPEEGSYQFLGQEVLRLKEKHPSALYKKHIGLVFQASHWMADLPFYEIIKTP